MHLPITLFAAAPLALLAACGDSTPAEEAGPAPTGDVTAMADSASAPGAEMPAVPANALGSVDYAGSYTLTDPEGRTSRISLREDDTYDYTAPDGTTRTGSYRRLEDGSRIMIEDFDGRAGYFSVADGAIYRLQGEDTPYDEITVTGMYRRENTSAQESGPGATTDSIADKRS